MINPCTGSETGITDWLRRVPGRGLNLPRRGFSLIEIAMVLAIAALIIAGVMLFFGNANNNEKAEETLQEVQAIRQAVVSLYTGNPSYNNLTALQVANSGLIPSKWVTMSGNKPTGLTSPFGGAIQVYNASGQPFRSFNIVLNQIPQDVCERLASTDLGPSVALYVINSVFASAPLPPKTAQTRCTAGATNQVRWVLR